MKYMGSKNRHAKELLPIILAGRKPDQYYVEPFCGGCNMIDKVDNPRIASDTHYYLIEFCKKLRDGWLPPEEISEKEYNRMKLNISDFEACFIGYVGFQMSYGAKFFGGYRRDRIELRNYSTEAFKNVQKQAPKLKGCEFYNVSYDELIIPARSIIYCDPPYANTTKYKTGDFDHARFWQWCEEMVQNGHSVFVSEYNAPENWTCVWEKTVNNTLTKNTGSKQGVEKLFTLLKSYL